VAVIRLVRIGVILLLAWLIQAFAIRAIARLHTAVLARRAGADQRRLSTVNAMLRNSGTVVVVLVAGMLVLGELGVSVAPLLATAGVAGLAIGFGAQSLIKDYFNGFFLLIEDQIREGDVVEAAGKGGQVEEVTLRYVRLRDFDGHVHFVPNGEIKVLTNRTRGFAYAVMEVGISYAADVDQALALMREVGAGLRADAAWSARIADDPEIVGVERLADSAVIVRCRVKVAPAIEQWNVHREFLKRLHLTYRARGIEIPFPQLTIHAAPPPPEGARRG